MIKNKKILVIVKFLAIYLGIIALYYIFISWENNPVMSVYIDATSYLSGFIINIFDSSVITNKQIIAGKSFNMILSFGCEGSEPLAVFFAGIMAFPSAFKSKIIGLSYGLPALYLLNIIRIILLYIIGNNAPMIFDITHTTIFPVIFIVIALSLWMLWIKRISQKSS
jgi:exosortase/archaeosortase family protein